MGKELVVFAVKDDALASLEEAEELLLYNMDTGEATRIRNPYKRGVNMLEEFFEDMDPSIMYVSSMGEELRFLVEENGVKVIIHPRISVKDLISELFI